MKKLHLILGVASLCAYLAVSIRGDVFGGTDHRVRSYGGRAGRSGGGIFFWGSGYSGGK